MNHQIGLGAFGTFGEPFGYQQVFFLNATFNSSLDLNTNAIEVYPGAELYAVKREMADGISSVCCCLYSYAKEPASNRGGTFIGVCVVLRNSYLRGEDIYTLLKELHTDVVTNPNNIIDNTLQVPKAAQLVVTEPAGFSRIKENKVAVNPAQSVPVDTQSKFLIQAPIATDTAAVATFFDTAVRYFTHTDTLYFTADKRIVAYVAEKGLIPTEGWEAFQQYKKQIIQQQKEAAKKTEAFRRGEKNQSVAKPVKVAAKPYVSKATASFGLLEPWINVDVSLSKEALGKMVQYHNTLLEEYLKLSQRQVAELPLASTNGSHPSSARDRPRFRVRRKHLMLTIIVLFILLVTTSVLLLLRPYNLPKEAVVPANSLLVADTTPPPKNETAPKALMPAANTELATVEAVKMVKDKIRGRKLNVIVDLLFIRNPKSIGEVYLGQKDTYAASLLRQNEGCFKKDSIGYTCTCDTLLHIPMFRK